MGVQLQTVRWIPQAIPTPAAGAEWSFTPQGMGGVLVKSLRFQFTTSAVVGNRLPRVVADDQTTIWWEAAAPTAVAATTTATYAAFDGGTPGTAANGLVTLSWPRTGLWLPQGNRLRSITPALDVADQYSNLAVLLYELPSGPFVRMDPTDLLMFEPLG